MENYLHLTVDIRRNNNTILDIDLYFENKFIVEAEDFLISKNKYKLKKNDKIFFLPGVNIPRVKIKNLTFTQGIKSIRDVKKADAVFMSDLTFGKMVENDFTYTMPVTIFKNYIEIIENELSSEQIEYVIKSLESYKFDNIIMTGNTYRSMANDNLNVIKNNPKIYNEIVDNVSSSYLKILKEEHIDTYNYLIGKEIFDESCIIEMLNGNDALTIDKKVFQQLESMLDSDDSENHTIAMEIMANCEYKSSLLHLMILFEKFNDIFSRSKFKNHINFKSLLSYLDMTPSNIHVRLDTVIELFIKREALTEEWADVILKNYDYRIRMGESKYFKCHTVTLDNEALKFLNINYKRQLTDDFVPVVVEKVEEVEETVSSSIVWI